LGKLSFSDVIKLSAEFTVAQMMERDMFQERVKNNQPIGLHEFLYPLMQGYDSVELKADVELGGTDQTFNMMAARPLQKAANQTPQCIMTMKILVGTDGKKKMGKTENNFIAVMDSPKDMFGKIMSIPDNVITDYFELCTNLTPTEINNIKKELAAGKNPRDIKMDLALKITTIYHDQKLAEEAKNDFIEVFSKGGLPEDIESIKISQSHKKVINLIDLLTEHKLVSSKSEARRLIEGGGIKINQEKVLPENINFEIKEETLIQIGKRKFIKFLPE